jgi:DNA-directed RNA polymerase specialized sigma24 family protein
VEEFKVQVPKSGRADQKLSIQHRLSRATAVDALARQELLNQSRDRLRILAARIQPEFSGEVRREDADGPLERALIRLSNAIEAHDAPTALDHFRFAAGVMRRELAEFSRRFSEEPRASTDGASSLTMGSDDAGGSLEPAEWTEFHRYVEQLDQPERTLFDLIWYHGLSMAETSALTRISLRRLARFWKGARINMCIAVLASETLDEAAAK